MSLNTITEPTKISVSVANTAPENGQTLSFTWFGLHDGSFDYFNEGEPASEAVRVLAEDAMTGDPQGQFTEEFINALVEGGADLSRMPAPEETLAGEFATSDAGVNGGYQALVFNNSLQTPLVHEFPGDSTTHTFELDLDPAKHGYFSYSGMPFPTNDGLIGNDDPMEMPLFDENGNFGIGTTSLRRA